MAVFVRSPAKDVMVTTSTKRAVTFRTPSRRSPIAAVMVEFRYTRVVPGIDVTLAFEHTGKS